MLPKKIKWGLLFAIIIILAAFMLPPSAHANIDTENTVLKFPRLSMRDGSLGALSITETNPGSLMAGQEITFTLINANLDGVVWNVYTGEKPESIAGAWIYAPPTVGGDKNTIKGLTIISQTPDSVTIRIDSLQPGDRGHLSIFVNGDRSDKNASLGRGGSVKLLISPPPGTGFIESEAIEVQKYNSNLAPAPAVQGKGVVPEAGLVYSGAANEQISTTTYITHPWPMMGQNRRNNFRGVTHSISSPVVKWSLTYGSNEGDVENYLMKGLGVSNQGLYYGSTNNMYALNKETGLPTWSYDPSQGKWFEYLPLITDDTIYFSADISCRLIAMNLDGTEKWNVSCVMADSTYNSIGPANKLSDGTIVCGSRDRWTGFYVHFFNPQNGQLLRRYTGPNANKYTSSPLAIGPDDTIYASGKDILIAINPDATEKWRFEVPNETPGYGWTSLSDDDSVVYFTVSYGIYALDAQTGSQIWYWAMPTKSEIPGADGMYYNKCIMEMGTAIGPDGTLYVGSENWNSSLGKDQSVLCAINPDGTTKWLKVIEGSVYEGISVTTDNVVYVFPNYDYDKLLRAYDGASGNEKWTIYIANNNESTPTIDSDGTVYACGVAVMDGGIDKSTLGKRPYCLYGKGSVNLSTGNYIQEETDLIVPSIGPPLEFTRFYNSTDTYEGPQGKGWTHNYNTHLTVNSDQSISAAYADGHVLSFAYNGSGYTRPAGSFETLEPGPNNTYILTFKDQTKYTYNAAGQLTSITDKNGNTLTLAYTDGLLASATEPASRSLTFTYDANRRISGIADSAGRSVSYTYNNGNLASVQDVRGEIIQYQYDTQGLTTIIVPDSSTLLHNGYDSGSRVTNQTDGSGNVTQFNYTQANETTMTDPLGNAITAAYDVKYRSTGVTYTGNITETFAYNENYCRTSVTDAVYHTTIYNYDSFGNLLTVTDPLGHITTMTYDGYNNLLTVTNATSKQIILDYDANNNLTGMTDPFGKTTHYTYLSDGLLNSKTTPAPDPGTTSYTYQDGLLQTVTDAVYHITTFGYDNFGNLHTVADAAGKTTTFNYDAAGNLTGVTNPLGNTTSFTYDWRGNILTKTDARGYITSYAYNGAGILDNIVDALNNKTQFNYDADNRLEKITDARGYTTMYSYDALGRLTAITDPLGYTINSQYDAAGNLTGKTDALGRQVLSASYNELNYPTTVTNALGQSIVNEYDSLSRLTSVTDPMSRVTQFDYDDLNRLITTTDAVYGQGSQGFDAHGNRISLIDPNSNTINFGYDSANRLISKTTASAGAYTLEYNNRNLLARKTNARGQITTCEYDDAGRLISSTNPDGTTSYTYDQNGNLLTATDSTGATVREYDALNRLFKYTDAQGNIIQYGYDAVGNLVTLTYPGGKQITYEYNAANRLVKVTDWASRITTYEYDPNGRLAKTTRPDGTVENCTYDDAGRLTQLKDTGAGGSVISQFDYKYDAKGNIINDNNTNESAPFTANSAALTYAADNRLATYEGQAVLYDADGNMTEGPLTGNMADFTFDARSRLTGAGNTSYTYDALNNRVRISDGVHQTIYVINPNAPLSQVLIKTDEGNTKTYFVYGLGLIGQDSGGVYHSYHFNHLGSTIALTDQSGNVTDRFRYAPYGELVYRSGDTATPFLFNGRHGVMTDTSDLYYMRARCYNPVAKRFISPDTLLGEITNPQSQNRYTYCEGNPVMYVDPMGYARIVTLNDFTINQSDYERLYERYKNLPDMIQNEQNILNWDYDRSEKIVAENNLNAYLYEYNVLNELLIINGNYDEVAKDNAKVALKNILNEKTEEIQEVLICFGGTGQIHHIASDKAIISGFTKQFERIFNKADLSLQNEANKMFLEGHAGRHSLKYLRYVLRRLTEATEGLSGDPYREALLKELDVLRIELINNPEIVKGVGLP